MEELKTNDTNIMLYEILEYLAKYYKNKGFTVFGLNDTKGITTLHPYLQKSIIELIKDFFKSYNMKNTYVDAFNVMINQPEYIDYLLNHNVSLKNINLMKTEGYIGGLDKILNDSIIMEELPILANIYRLKDLRKKEETGIRDILKESTEPLVIYASGYSSLIRTIKEKYERNYEKEKEYNYVGIYKNDVLPQNNNKLKKNIEHILSINPTATIMALNSNRINTSDPNLLELILYYNELLRDLCDDYNITYIDTTNMQDSFNGSFQLATTILEKLYQEKINRQRRKPIPYRYEFPEDNLDIRGVLRDINKDYNDTYIVASRLSKEDKNKEINKAQDILRERRVIEKVLRRTK